MTVPLVSIALPVYNGEKWLEQAISTLIKQSYENVEIIIADDCSSDNSQEICEQYQARFGDRFVDDRCAIRAERWFPIGVFGLITAKESTSDNSR